MLCRQCSSDNIRKLSLVFEQGSTLVDTSTSGVAVGLGLMAGAGRTRGRHVTAASARAAPPAKKQYGAQVALAFVCLFFAIGYPALWIGVALFGLAAVTSINYNSTTWRGLYASWDLSYMCERCGWVGPPLQRPEVAAVPASYEPALKSIAPVQVALQTEDGAQKICPHCRSYIPAGASVCRYCQRDVTPPPAAIAP